MRREPLLPGSTIGIVGGGQLGRMLAAVAGRMGYRSAVLAPEASPPAAAFATEHVRAEYGDVAAVRAFAAQVDVLTFEFENVSSEALAAAAEVCAVRPGPVVLHTTQDRGREKTFLARHAVPHVAFRRIDDAAELAGALAAIGYPCVVKTAGFGYDGKGQQVVASREDRAAISGAERLAVSGPVVVERLVDLALELSVVGARTVAEERVFHPVVNRHSEHILDLSYTPRLGAGADAATADEDLVIDEAVARRAEELTRDVMRLLDLTGLLCVEFFLDRSGELLVNEIAPRPHNSGHLTIEAATTSQFEQQLRAVCALPLGDTALITPAAMANLMGERWRAGPPAFHRALTHRGVSLHLYGKREARPGRKMGHLTAVAGSAGEAVRRVLTAREALQREDPRNGPAG